MPDTTYLLQMLVGYSLSVAVETAVLLLLLSRRHSVRVRLFAGVWLTACTYPVVWLVLPPLFPGRDDRLLYLWVAETFAPAAECLIFWFAFVRGRPGGRWSTARDFATIILANLCSFGVGILFADAGGFDRVRGGSP